jgi:hypothetical protein
MSGSFDEVGVEVEGLAIKRHEDDVHFRELLGDEEAFTNGDPGSTVLGEPVDPSSGGEGAGSCQHRFPVRLDLRNRQPGRW